jgi:ABC-type transport system involved in multi-copper enzyme maturation permease subunit
MKVVALILNTFRELLAKATLIILAIISTLILIGVALAVSTSTGPDGVTLLLFGGQATPPLPPENIGMLLQPLKLGLAGGLFTGIILFGVFATAGIIPDALEKGTVDLYLSKPIHRWELLLGKQLGAVFAIFLNIIYFIGALCVIFGLRLGVWDFSFLLSGLSMAFMFACFFSLVVFTGVVSRSTAISIIVAFLYLFVFGSLLESRQTTLYRISEGTIYRAVLDGLYYIFPQVNAMQSNVMKQITSQPMDWVPFLQSFLSGVALFGAGAFVMQRRDF